MHKLTVHTTTFTEAAIVDGEYGDGETSSEEFDCEPDSNDDEETVVSIAASLIRDRGLTQTSSVPWGAGAWYCDPDGSTIVDYGTGEREDCSAHLDGFTVEEEAAVFALVSA